MTVLKLFFQFLIIITISLMSSCSGGGNPVIPPSDNPPDEPPDAPTSPVESWYLFEYKMRGDLVGEKNGKAKYFNNRTFHVSQTYVVIDDEWIRDFYGKSDASFFWVGNVLNINEQGWNKDFSTSELRLVDTVYERDLICDFDDFYTRQSGKYKNYKVVGTARIISAVGMIDDGTPDPLHYHWVEDGYMYSGTLNIEGTFRRVIRKDGKIYYYEEP